MVLPVRCCGRGLPCPLKSPDKPDPPISRHAPQMELRYKEAERARAIFERYVRCLPCVKAWVRFAKFEAQSGEFSRARGCYERAVQELGEDGQTVWHLL